MKNKYKILMLTDLKSSSKKELKNAVSFAKLIQGDLHVFHAKKSTELVKKESQLSAIRAINETYKATENKLKKLKNVIEEEQNFQIDYSFTFGNIEEEITSIIENTEPNLIVLGKKTKNYLRLIGDNVTEFVLKKYNGPVMIIDSKNQLKSDNSLSLGALNTNASSNTVNFSSDLFTITNKPMTFFQIGPKKTKTISKAILKNDNSINYSFEHSDASLQTLSKYIAKRDINLLFVERESKTRAEKKLFANNFKPLINQLPVNLLIAGKQEI